MQRSTLTIKDVSRTGHLLRALAFAGGLGNVLGNLAVMLFGGPLFGWLGVPLPADGYTFTAMAGLSFTMGVAILLGAANPDRNIDLFRVAALGKLTFVAVTAWFALGSGLPLFWGLIAGFDAFYAVVFLLYLVRMQSRDLERLQRGDILSGLPRPRTGRALVLTFSLTGAGRAAIDRVKAGLERTGYRVDLEAVRPLEPLFRFPMPLWDFTWIVVRAMFRVPAPSAPLRVDADHDYDLVVVQGQTWMMGLSSPIEALFQRPDLQAVFTGRDVAAVVVCRGAWRRSQAMLVRRLEASGGNVVGARGHGHQGKEPGRLCRLWVYLITKGQARAAIRYGLSAEALTELEVFGEALGRRPGSLPSRAEIDAAA